MALAFEVCQAEVKGVLGLRPGTAGLQGQGSQKGWCLDSSTWTASGWAGWQSASKGTACWRGKRRMQRAGEGGGRGGAA